MSLLMQALKKAEQAKQQTDEPGASAPAEKKPVPAAPEGLSLSPIEPATAPAEPPPAEPAKPADDSLALSMEEPPKSAPSPAAAPLSFPAIEETPAPLAQKPVEPLPAMPPEPEAPAAIVTPEPPAPPVNKAAPEPTPAPPAPPAQAAARTAAPTPEVRPQQKTQAAQQTAKAVFYSKQPQGKKSGFRIAIAGLTVLLLASAGFGYYYIQNLTQKSSMLVASTRPQQPVTPEPAAAAQAADPAAVAPVPAAAIAATTPDSVSSGKLTGGQTASSAEAAAQARNLPPAGKPSNAEAEPKIASAQAPGKAASSSNHGITIRQTSNTDHINPTLAGAYQAFVAGDIGTAQQKYQQVLQHDAGNRDALLGLAAISITRKQTAQAASLYLKLLELDPADADAVAGLTSLQQGNLAQNESRLKKIIADNPNAVAVQFVLGNLYAQQSRWAEAQQAYFQAFGGAPGNADYAFNLAVSLDRLSQAKLSLEYYQRALSLAQNGSGNFSKSAVQTRIRELQSLADN